MIDEPRIVVADRSELAGNLYRLLLAPIGATLIVRRRFEEARPHFFRRERVHLGIINSNVFGKKFDEIVRTAEEQEPFRRTPKIFLCRPTPAEQKWAERLRKLSKAAVIMRPFHPDELAALVGSLLRKEGI